MLEPAGAVDYEEPDFAERLFSLDAISLEGDARERVIIWLLGVVPGLVEGDAKEMDLAEKAMAIALRLDSLHPEGRALNDALIGEGEMPELEIFSREEAGVELWEIARGLRESPEPEDRVLAPYLMDVAMGLAGEQEAWREELEEVLGQEGISLGWAGVMKLESEPEPEPEADSEEAMVVAETEPDAVVNGGNDGGEGDVAMVEEADSVLPPPSPEVTVLSLDKEVGPVASFRLSEAQVGALLYPKDDNVLDDPKFWMRPGVSVGELAAEVQAMVGFKPGGGGPRRVYADAGFGEETRRAIMSARQRFEEKHGEFPPETRVELTLSGEGDMEAQALQRTSLAAPFYVLVDAMALGGGLDGGIALGGYLDGEGNLRSTLRVGEVLKAVAEAGVASVVMPESVEELIRDVAIRGDVETLMRTQVFGIDSIDEAGRYMMREREASVDEAIGLYGEVQALLGGNWTVDALLRNPAVQERLARVVSLCPDHLSAKVLLAYGRGQLPEKCSLAGSIFAIEDVASARLASFEGSTDDEPAATTSTTGTISTLGGRDEIFDLRNLRPKLHPDTVAYSDAVADVLEVGGALMEFRNRTTTQAQQKVREMSEAGGRLVSEREGLLERLKLASNG
ncbi:MAG: hypothetical protein AAGD22_13380 [Verrucomicrobiota bacterium]